jgi:chorismate mutase/prephenate dehydratase
MSTSKQKIYYLGPKGSYTQQAAREFFGKKKLVEGLDMCQILDNIAQQKNAYGVVPVENSMEGSLNLVLDTVVEKKLKIIGEIFSPISHCLVGRERNIKKIKTIYSHPQALAQCGDWLRQNLPLAELKEASSTSAAAKIALNQKNSAAIVSKYCAKVYRLNILAEQLEEDPNNYTRFWVLTNKIVRNNNNNNNKISVFIILNDQVGALRDLLDIFAKHNINLTKIESRMLKGRAWHYGFFIDFFGNLQDNKVKRLIKSIEREVARLEVLGNYQNQQNPNETTDYLINYLQKLFKQNQKFVAPLIKPALSLSKGVGGGVGTNNLLIKLLQTRLLLIPSVALYKYIHKIPLNKIYQPKREQEIIKKRLVQIKKKNISASKLLLKLANKNLLISKELQKDIYKNLAGKKIKPEQIKNIELSKLRDFLDQIDENFDEVLANLPTKEQERVLNSLINKKNQDATIEKVP